MNRITIKRLFLLSFVGALVAVACVGCNTAHGFGKDMENAGEKIQDGTN
jgi:predicted small secreted protein